MRDAFLQGLNDLAIKDSDIMLLTADLGFGVFEDFEKRFPDQYFNVGVAEQLMTGIASGLALEGKKVFTYSIGNFPTLRTLEQIRNDAAYHELNINIVASGGGFSYGQLGMSHHATEDISILRSLPGVEVYTPCTAYESLLITKELSLRNKVGYLRLDKTKAVEPDNKNIKFEFGKMRLFKEGDDIAFIVAGGILNEVLEAAKILNVEEKLNSRVVACHSIKPIDEEMIIKCASENTCLITVEENNICAGLGSAVAEVLMDKMIFPSKFARYAIPDLYSSVVGNQNYLRKFYNLDSISIAKRAKNLLSNS